MPVTADVTGRAGGENGPVMTMARLRELVWPRSTAPLPPLTPRGQVFDALVALVVAVGGAVYATTDLDPPRLITVFGPPGFPPSFAAVEPRAAIGPVLVAVVAGAALAVRRRYPLTVLWIVIGATLVAVHPRLTFYACVIAAYTATAYSPHRTRTFASLAVAALAIGVVQESNFAEIPDAYATVPSRYATFLILISIVVAANDRRTWRRRADQSKARMAVLELERARAVRRAAEQERARIARELHDVVTHNVSVMVIQAGAARSVLATDADQAREALLAVEAGGRAAMAELRHVMGLLTVDTAEAEPGAADLAPQPGLDRLAALVGRVRDIGVPVELTVAGEPRSVPTGAGLTAYRVVQEALTNTVKHAVGAAAAVTVEYRDSHLRVEVTDTGGRPGAAAGTGTGRGLIGLRERLAVYGGTLQAGRRPSGGYRVDALIPLEAS
jgi:signal transduction histidine kinase